MPEIMGRLTALLKEQEEDLPCIRENAADPVKDEKGSCSSSLALDLRFLGIARYLLQHDVREFKAGLTECANIRNDLFTRFERGEPISASYVAMLAYKELFDALAAGAMDVAKQLASHMGGRDAIEKEYDHPFDYALGYTLKSFVLDNRPEMQRWLEAFAEVCQQKEFADFRGYVQVFRALIDGDTAKVDQGLAVLVKGHERQSKGAGIFAGIVDEALCVWGVGMANLARSRGLPVKSVPPLIPDDLLI